MKKQRRTTGALITTLVMIFFYLPIVFMVVFSFNSSKSLTHFTGFSIKWYQQMLQSHDMMNSLYITIVIAMLATLISTVVGTLTAIGLSYSKKLTKAYVQQINDLPMMNPDIVTAIGLMLLFITFHIERGFITLLLAHVAFCIPYVMLSVMPKLRQLDPNLADAAMDLGATPFQTLTKVIIPEIIPGILSGAIIAFTMSFDDFIISYFATGNGIKNLSIMVYTMSKRVNPSINAISTLLVLLITVVLILVNVVPIIRKKIQEKREQDPNYEPSPHKHTGRNLLIGALVVTVGLVTLFLRPTSGGQMYAGQTLHIYMPGEYISEEMITTFEEYTGATLVIDNFDSNEQMYIKVANHESFDVLIPSDYMIQRLIGEDLLMPLDQSKVDETIAQLDEQVCNLAYDPQNLYSIPYFWGTVGISYDKEKVSREELEAEGWAIFQDPKFVGDIYLYDSERDQFMTALKSLGYSMNTSDEQQLAEAYTWLETIVKTMKPEIVTDEIIDNMANARKALGLIYSGDATYVSQENEQMGFFLPEEGTNIWVDGMCIPKSATNVELAYEFINYAASYEAQMMNSSYVGYTATNLEAKQELAQGEFEGYESYSFRKGHDLDEVFEYNPDSRKTIADYWSRIKVVASNSN